MTASPVRPDAQTGSRPPGHLGILVTFLPWIIFAVVAGPSTWEFAALAALVASLLLVVPELRHGSAKVLNVLGTLFFAALAVLALVLDRQDLAWLEQYAQVISGGVLTVVVLGSLPFAPFTEQYARESTPSNRWDTPEFRRVNRVLTAAWGVAFLVTTVCALVALRVTSGQDWFSWIIPIAALVLAVKVTGWYPAHVRSRSVPR